MWLRIVMHRVEIIAPFQSWLPIDHQPTASLARNKAPQKKNRLPSRSKTFRSLRAAI
jgi:hypothetical protein